MQLKPAEVVVVDVVTVFACVGNDIGAVVVTDGDDSNDSNVFNGTLVWTDVMVEVMVELVEMAVVVVMMTQLGDTFIEDIIVVGCCATLLLLMLLPGTAGCWEVMMFAAQIWYHVWIFFLVMMVVRWWGREERERKNIFF